MSKKHKGLQQAMASGRPVQQAGRPVPSSVSISRQEITVTQSPFLPGEELAKIEMAVSGGANRALLLIEKQSDHRMKQENRVVLSNIIGERFGQLVGAVIGLGGIYAGYQLILAGRDTQGFVAILLPLAALVAVFVTGRKKRDRALGSKDVHR